MYMYKMYIHVCAALVKNCVLGPSAIVCLAWAIDIHSRLGLE